MKTIAVIMGGPSVENEISLRTGREILVHINKDTYHMRAVVIDQQRRFYARDLSGHDDVPTLEQLHEPVSAQFSGPFTACDCATIWQDCDLALLAVHGEFGEDGVLQGYLETIGMPYTGSGVYASAVGMNKIATKHIFTQVGLCTPPASIYRKNHPDMTIDYLVRTHGFPCFVKCPQSGSSRLMGKASFPAELRKLLAEYEQHSPEILVETAIKGDEYSCPVLELPDGSLQALAPILIKPLRGGFFDYEAKYTSGGSEEIVPAPCSAQLSGRIQQAALLAHRAIGCRGISRTDMIYCDDRLYVLEINTLPGLTSASLTPKSYEACNGTYAGLLDTLIETALRQNTRP